MYTEKGEVQATCYADLQVLDDPNARTRERRERRAAQAPARSPSPEPRIVRSGFGERAQLPRDVARMLGLHETVGTGASFRGWERSQVIRKALMS